MSGRIATAPIGTDAATVGDFRSRALVGDQREPFRDDSSAEQQVASPPAPPEPAPKPQPSAGAALPTDAPGTAFAAAVLAGSLPPQPLSAQEILLRGGSAWAPPDSELHLTDRTA